MKAFTTLLSILIFASCVSSKETHYTASTPADPLVRTFLGISLTDSIDFIRWKLSLTDNKYSLQCSYGIGKPNTNGFYEEKKVEFSGTAKKENNNYILERGNHMLKFAELNDNLLHIVNKENTLLIGGAGWSYALNNIVPSATNHVNLKTTKTVFKDSMAFEGRTPCGVPNIIEPGKQCYKLKWYVVLYNKGNDEQGVYRILGTPYRREEGGKRGNWKIMTGKDGRIVYQLNDEKGNPYIRLLKLDDGVLIFTDEKGNLLVGDHDFSYTLNREF